MAVCEGTHGAGIAQPQSKRVCHHKLSLVFYMYLSPAFLRASIAYLSFR